MFFTSLVYVIGWGQQLENISCSNWRENKMMSRWRESHQLVDYTELKMTEWKTTVHISSSSQSSIATQQKIVLADGSLCSRQQSGGEGGGPARTALLTLRANADCAYIGFHLYCFPFCHLKFCGCLTKNVCRLLGRQKKCHTWPL